jgi:hypothetical protein
VITRLRHVAPRDWPAVLATVGVALAVELGIRALRLPTVARWARVPLGGSEGVPADDALEVLPVLLSDADRRRLRVATLVMRHWPFDEKCLRMALVCGYRIRRLGPRLVIGVALVDGEVKAHAWLTVDGVSLDPSGSATFLSLTPIPRR